MLSHNNDLTIKKQEFSELVSTAVLKYMGTDQLLQGKQTLDHPTNTECA